MMRILSVAELAEDAFLKRERVRAMEAANEPLDYEDRKKAFIELAVARSSANEAESRMLRAMEAKPRTAA